MLALKRASPVRTTVKYKASTLYLFYMFKDAQYDFYTAFSTKTLHVLQKRKSVNDNVHWYYGSIILFWRCLIEVPALPRIVPLGHYFFHPASLHLRNRALFPCLHSLI